MPQCKEKEVVEAVGGSRVGAWGAQDEEEEAGDGTGEE